MLPIQLSRAQDYFQSQEWFGMELTYGSESPVLEY